MMMRERDREKEVRNRELNNDYHYIVITAVNVIVCTTNHTSPSDRR